MMIINTFSFFICLIIFLVFNILIITTLARDNRSGENPYPSSDKDNTRIPSNSEQRNHQIKKPEKAFGQETESDEDEGITYDIRTVNIIVSIQRGMEEGVKNIDWDVERFSKENNENQIKEELNNLNDISKIPKYYSKDHKFYTYTPYTFRYLRTFFGIKSDDYVKSMCKSSLIVLSNSGASKSVFYLTPDSQFILKSLQNNENTYFIQILGKYIYHFTNNSESLLPKYFGYYQHKSNSDDIQLVSMNNLLPSNVKMHVKFDLKGSNDIRSASVDERTKINPTFEDNDFTEQLKGGLLLMPFTRNDLLGIIERDTDFLKNINSIDYSLLLGIHKIDKDNSICKKAAEARFKRLMVNSKSMKHIQNNIGTIPEEKDCPTLRGSIPAIIKNKYGVERLLLFVGIIDILQEYGLWKKLETDLKTFKILISSWIKQESRSPPVQHSADYAFRYLKFMTDRVFKELSQNDEALIVPNTYNTQTPNSFQRDHLTKEQETEFDKPVGINYDIRTVYIIVSIQRGIEEAVKNIDWDVKRFTKEYVDDKINEELNNLNDINNIPKYYNNDLTFFTYTPYTFRYFRTFFGIKSNDYVKSMCKSSLIVLSNSGASKSVFYLTPDSQFILKSLQKNENINFLQLLGEYINHLTLNSGSLLPKYSGYYQYKINSDDIQLVSMNNLLPPNVKMHVKFDLKGSNYGRSASDKEKMKKKPTFKDNDFTEQLKDGLLLMPSTRTDLLGIIERDIDFLKHLNLMDYSLLLGIHKIDKDNSICKKAAEARFERLMVNSKTMKHIQEDIGTIPQEKDCPTLRGSIPAIIKNEYEVERLLLFVGIIDILQDYGLRKKLEKDMKTFKILMSSWLKPEFRSPSVQHPADYASRYLKFMTDRVFKELSQKVGEDKASIVPSK